MEEEKITNNNEEFKKVAINGALSNIKSKFNLSESDIEKLLELYMKDNRDIKIIFDEINQSNESFINTKLNKIKANNEPNNKITLDNIEDFENKEKTKRLIKIHYPYPDEKIKVIENHSGKTAKELFEEHKDENGLVAVNGFVNLLDVSREYVEPEKIEIKLYNVTELARKGEFSKLNTNEKECVYGLVSTIINKLGKTEEEKRQLKEMPIEQLILKLNKNVFIAPSENIVIMCIPNELSKDEIKAVTKNNYGKYELDDLKLDDKQYSNDYNSQDESPVSDKAEEINKEEKMKPFIKRPIWEQKRAS